jgi:hypothetical protein
VSKKYENLDPSTLRQLLDYDPETGALTWRERPVEMFEDHGGRYTAQWCMRTFNNKCANKPAFTAKTSSGYRNGGISHKGETATFSAHRVAWALYYGAWPDGEIDHANRVRDDNRIENLRLATRTENGHNKKPQNKYSPYVGVTWYKRSGRWVAKVYKEGRLYHVGTFDCPVEAAKARDAKSVELYGDRAFKNLPAQPCQEPLTSE